MSRSPATSSVIPLESSVTTPETAALTPTSLMPTSRVKSPIRSIDAVSPASGTPDGLPGPLRSVQLAAASQSPPAAPVHMYTLAAIVVPLAAARQQSQGILVDHETLSNERFHVRV